MGEEGVCYDGNMVNVTDQLIEEMALRIVREVDPERIILFGSWARGEADGEPGCVAVGAGFSRCPFGEDGV